MFYVYVLKSKNIGDVYIGYSENPRQRISSHNSGKVRSTKPYRPWKLIYYEGYVNKKDARKRERQLKNHKPKSDLLKQIENSFL